MTKRILALLLCLVLGLTLFPVSAFAEAEISAEQPTEAATDEASASLDIPINATLFPDPNFRAVVAGSDIDKDQNGSLSESEIAAVTSLYAYDKSISSLQGIEYFTALTTLYCYRNQLTSLDVTRNHELTHLDCGFNQLTSLDLSGTPALTYLTCNGNPGLSRLNLYPVEALRRVVTEGSKTSYEDFDWYRLGVTKKLRIMLAIT